MERRTRFFLIVLICIGSSGCTYPQFIKRQTQIQTEELKIGDPIQIKTSSAKTLSGKFILLDSPHLLFQPNDTLATVAVHMDSIQTIQKIELENHKRPSLITTVLVVSIWILILASFIVFSDFNPIR